MYQWYLAEHVRHCSHFPLTRHLEDLTRGNDAHPSQVTLLRRPRSAPRSHMTFLHFDARIATLCREDIKQHDT